MHKTRPFFKVCSQKIQPCKFSAPKDQKQKSYDQKTSNSGEYQPPLKLPRMTAEDPPLRRVGPGFFPRLHFELEFKENQILLFLLRLLNFSKYSGSI